MKQRINSNLTIVRTFTFLPFSRVKIIDMMNELFWVILVRFYGFLLPWKSRDTVAFTTHPLFILPITGYKMVYDRCDRYGKYKDLNFIMAKRQADDIKFMKKANLVINSSESLRKEALHYNRNSILARNGADLAHFKKTLSLPKEGKAPVIGYVGALAYWVNFKLLIQIVATYPEYELHVIGPTAAVERNPDFMALKRMKNAKIFGRIPYENLPFYLKEFDVGIVPFTPDELIEAVDPLKVYEYMAAGRPVVSTDLPELRRLKNCIYIAKNDDEFVKFCKQAVENPKVKREDLVKEAFENTWEKRAELIETEIRKIIQ